MKFEFAGTPRYIDDNYNVEFLYKGINLMDYEAEWKRWNNTYQQLHFHIGKDKQKFSPSLFELTVNHQTVIFGAGEISNGIWGFALPIEDD